ncbi:hypothetical protein UFOVP276_182 [uncultured Caudovirales phage]|uniref:Uncharacterized protein n=1 Tax=uncultured Caudovirales phage TaxID=2100421 RepID=A0A6J5LQN7_9CAUD|nr:hypothetical protein UFOVP127_76 [uncultured Caudovirales phage]CAB4135226.1 hypothetical protein UFOVP276_182 [uncultured Caudovirales phage]
MTTTYITDHHIKPEGQWTGKEMKDWLHPCHGPLPNRLGAVRHEDEEYMVALWITKSGIVTLTELVSLTRIQEEWDNMPRKKGWVANSLYWSSAFDRFVCEDRIVRIPYTKCRGSKVLLRKDEEDMCRSIMVHSVEITARTPIGGTVTKAEVLLKG